MIIIKQGWKAENCLQPHIIILEDLNLQKNFHTSYDYGIPLLPMDIPSFILSYIPKTERLFWLTLTNSSKKSLSDLLSLQFCA